MRKTFGFFVATNHKHRPIGSIHNLPGDISYNVGAPTISNSPGSSHHKVVVSLHDLIQNLVYHNPVTNTYGSPHPGVLDHFLGFFAAVNMLVMTALSHHSYFSKSTLSRINGMAYVISTLIWLAYAALPSTVRGGAKQVAEATQKWDQALDDARNAAPVTSLLDSMDQTVERLLYHRESEAGVTVATRR